MTLHRLVLIAVSVAALVAVAPEAQGYGGTPITSCGQTVTTNSVLKHDLVCTGQGIVVGASGITIDLNGFVIRGNRSASHYGINDTGGYDNVSVKNGVLRNFQIDVFAQGADKLSISNVVLSGSIDWGVYVQAGTSASISSVNASGNGFGGIELVGNSASVASSTASANAVQGIYILGTSASVKASTADGNTEFGISIQGNSAQVTSSTASANDFGFEIYGDSASIKSSTASGNTDVGIFVSGNSASLKSNTADANGFVNGASDLTGLGIQVQYVTTPPTGSKNTALGNDDPTECLPASLC